MPEESSSRLMAVFYIPSFYGALTWGIWLLLYLLQLIQLNECSVEAMVIYITTEICFVISAYLSYPIYRDKIVMNRNVKEYLHPACGQHSWIRMVLLALHAIGFTGLALWLVHLAEYLGGINLLLFALLNAAETIRGDTNLPTTIGIQLTYFGWLAIALTVFAIAKKQVSKWWMILALLQFAGNFLFIGRTQPLWIMYTSLLMALVSFVNVSIKRTVIWLALGFFVFVTVFWALGEWTGKTYYEGKFENPAIPGATQVMYAYGVSGFAYFNHMLVNHEPIAYTPERTLYPLMKSLSRFGLAKEPPSQIIEFYDIPFETNVGTFLEPFYRDGGILFVLIGVLVYSFGLDIFGLKLLQSGRPLALYAWSNLCFTALIGFMTPKITQFPVWLFVGLGLTSLLIRAFHTNILKDT